MKISRTITTLALGALLAQGAVSTASAQQAGTTKIPAINFADMDKAVRPQTDFYHYVNGGWIRKNPLKPAYSRFGTSMSSEIRPQLRCTGSSPSSQPMSRSRGLTTIV